MTHFSVFTNSISCLLAWESSNGTSYLGQQPFEVLVLVWYVQLVQPVVRHAKMPKIRAIRLRSAYKMPFWLRITTDVGKIAQNGSPSSLLFGSLLTIEVLELLWYHCHSLLGC